MGRIAGPRPGSNTWKLQVMRLRKEKERLGDWVPPVAPIVHPPSKRRQMALLWYIGRYFEDGMIVGARGWPPLTPDMRALLAKKHLSLARYHAHQNRVKITSAGAELLKCTPPAEKDKFYIVMTTHTQSVR